MAVSTRIIRRRIKTVANTKKITKAMELVSAAKMRRAVSMMLAGRPYAQAAREALGQLSSLVDSGSHPLLRSTSSLVSDMAGVSKTLVILMTSDRSLCGGFNSKLFAATNAFIRENGFENVEFAVLGTKGQDFLRKKGVKVVAAWNAPAKHPTFVEVKPIADLAIADFLTGKYSRVVVITTDYKSALVQTVKTIPLLPIIAPSVSQAGEAFDEELDDEVEESENDADHEREKDVTEMLFEPKPSVVLSAILPRLIEAQVYHALLESLASEHSARMLAMRSATDNAGEMIESLTLTFNQARQAGITREIAEISAGAAAIA